MDATRREASHRNSTVHRTAEHQGVSMTEDSLLSFSENRSRFYWFLSEFYNEMPSADFLSQLRSKLSTVDISLPDELGESILQIQDILQSDDFEALSVRLLKEYTRLMRGVKKGYGPSPPYESVFRGERRVGGEVTLEVNNFYQRAGFGFDFPGPKDYLGVELRFMAFLCLEEMSARKELDSEKVEKWLKSHASDLDKLAQKRRLAAEKYRDTVNRRNMEELVDFLTGDSDMLPCEAAEKISIRRIAASESDRSVSDVMAQIPTVHLSSDVRTCAERLIEAGCSILAVLSEDQDLTGVVTRWDITRAVGTGELGEMSVADIMTRDVISAAPDESLLEAIRKLEHHEISAMPVVEDGEVRGVISTDLLATRSLLRLLQSQID